VKIRNAAHRNASRGGSLLPSVSVSAQDLDWDRLREQNELLKQAQEIAGLGTYRIDLGSRTILLSREMATMFGAGDDEIELSLEEYRRRFYHPDDLASGVATAEPVYRWGGDLWLTSRVVRSDGGVIWVQTRSAVDEHPDGTRSVLGVVRDVTAEVRSQERNRLLATLVESSDDAMLTTDLTGSITSWNPGAERLYGISADEVVGHQISFITGQVFDPEHAAEKVDDQDERLRRVASGEIHRHQLLHRRRKDGTPFIMSASAWPLRDDEGSIVGAALIGRDVTELEEAHAEVRASEQRFRALVQRGSDLIGLIDADGTLRYISPSLSAISGRDPQEVVGRRFTEFAHPDDAQDIEALLELLVRSPGSRVKLTYRIVHKDGGVRHLDAISTNLIDVPEVGGIVFNARDVTEAVEYREQLAHQALHDPLTGLANRALLVDRIGQGLRRGAHGGRAILLLDVDHFQAVNDAFGYSIGDEVLIGLGQRLSHLAQATDTVARVGGDRFAIWCEQCTADAAREFADRVVRTIGEPFTADHHDVSITASVGVALDPGDRPVRAEGLLRDVNVAILQAKERGRGRFEVFDLATSGAAKSRLELRSELLTALREGQLVLHYQPEIRLEDERTVGAEALVRWLHPERGLIPPMQFIPAAEDSDLILAIGRWVCEAACRDAATWPATAGPAVVSVNLSAREFTDPDLLEHITDALTSSGLPANRLCLEITETLLMRDVERTAELLEVIKGLGALTAIDDFGTGYSSLAYLTRLPVDYLKIDRVFVEGLDRDLEKSDTVVAAVIGLAKRLGIKTIAEGVETETQAAALRRLGCDLAQGFLYARPMPHEDFLDRIAAGRW
jgi:diguanylate cyclase (GGDEF)-like protein/PAS domain S-box-containing protein